MADRDIDVQELYVAYFGRPADPGGLQYWAGGLADGRFTLDAISRSFAASQEYRDTYAGMDNRAIVTEVYDNLFSREAEPFGLDYWAGLMDKGAISVDDVVKEVSKAALDKDDLVFNGKVAAAAFFTRRLDEPHEVAAYTGGVAREIAMEFIAAVRDLDSVVDALKSSVVDAWISRIIAERGAIADVELVGVAPGPDALPVY